jgi:hypothetical protein
MTDLHDNNYQPVILDRVNNAIDALAKTIPLLTGKFLTSYWSRIVTEGMYLVQYPTSVGLWHVVEVLPY